MNAARRKRLEAAGWRVGTVAEFLKLTPQQMALIDMKLALGDALKRQRVRRGLTQKELARKLRSSQSRVAKMEAGEPGITFDLLIRALLTAGATPAGIARAMAARGGRAAA